MKTYKREVAIALLVWLAYVVETKDATIIEVLVWPVFAFSAAAFGLDAAAKQLRDTSFGSRGRSQRSSQYPARQREQSDSFSEEG